MRGSRASPSCWPTVADATVVSVPQVRRDPQRAWPTSCHRPGADLGDDEVVDDVRSVARILRLLVGLRVIADRERRV